MKNLNELQLISYLAEGCGDWEVFAQVALRMFNRFLFDGQITKEEYVRAMKFKDVILQGVENGKKNC